MIYLNAGFGRPIGRRTLAYIKNHFITGVRQDIPYGIPDDNLKVLLDELAALDMQAVLIVGGWMRWEGEWIVSDYFRDNSIPSVPEVADFSGHVARIAGSFGFSNPSAIEIGNEPTITKDFSDDPYLYAKLVRECYKAVLSVNSSIDVAAGSVHDLTKGSREYLMKVLGSGIPGGIVLVVHPYRPGNKPWQPFAGFKDIDDAISWLKARWMGRFAVSEMGWHTAPRTEKSGLFGLCKKRVQWSDIEVAQFVSYEIDRWMRSSASWYNHFQLNDGPDPNNPEHRFGIRDFYGRDKPVAQVLEKASRDWKEWRRIYNGEKSLWGLGDIPYRR